MNTIYKLIFNTATGTWSVANELTASRGKKARLRLAAAVVVALALPTGAAFAADSPLQCGVDQSVSADGLRCEMSSTSKTPTIAPSAIGTAAIPDAYTAHGGDITGGSTATATGSAALALGANTRATGNYAIAIGAATSRDANGGRGAFAGGSSSVSIGVLSEARGDNSVALGANSLADRDDTVSVGAVSNRDGVSFTRQIVNMAAGDLSANSTDAVNGSQLFATNANVTANTTAITSLDDRVTTSESKIGDLETAVSSGTVGLVQQDATTNAISVASTSGGTSVDFSGTDGTRRLSGIANGVGDTDAVTIAQLRAAGAIDPISGNVLSVLTYDDASLGRATLGGTAGTIIGNLGAGVIAAGSMDAVNGGQLYSMNADWEAKWNQLDGRVGSIEQGVADGTIGGGAGGSGSGSGSVVIGEGADASGENALASGNGASASGTGAIATGTGASASGEGALASGTGATASGSGAIATGAGSNASGTGAVAIGEGANASGKNSVAIGAGSTADRDNELSVGSAGNERVVSNVAAGTRPTDAVNLQQMDDRFQAERDWASGQFQAVDKRMDRMGAMNAAMVNMAVSAAGVHTENRVGAGVGFQNGRSALSVGYQRALSERATVTLGGSFSGSEASVGFGAGFGW